MGIFWNLSGKGAEWMGRKQFYAGTTAKKGQAHMEKVGNGIEGL